MMGINRFGMLIVGVSRCVRGPAAGALLAAAAWCAEARAQWSVTLLHPSGASASSTYGAGEGRQGGNATFQGVTRAGSWNGSASGWVSVHPLGYSSSGVSAVDGSTMVGDGQVSGLQRALMWTNSGMIDLTPLTASWAIAGDVHAGQQVGTVFTAGAYRASVWSGTQSSWTSLHPENARNSYATAVHAGTQVGYADIATLHRAGMWRGEAATWESLHPINVTQSFALDIHGSQQVGYVETRSQYHAALWSGTAES